MPADHTFPTDRPTLTRLLFPAGVPILRSLTLMCYDEAGSIDRGRQLAHFAFLTPHVKGYLVPGSTGDAWEMDDAEALAALEVAIPFAVQHGVDLLVGVLRPTTDAMHALIDKVLNYLCRRAGTDLIADAFAASHVRGLTIAAPTTDTPLSQNAIGAALAPVFELGLPIALYQLPQVTGNTMTPELVAGLAERFPNLLLFKDSSGADEVALSGRMPAGVTLLRGAEGDYAQWSKAHGGRMMASCSALPTPSRPSSRVCSNISSTGALLKLNGARRPFRQRLPMPLRPSSRCGRATPSRTPTRLLLTSWPMAVMHSKHRRRGSTPAVVFRSRS